MEFILQSEDISDYLKADKYMDFFHRSIQEKARELFAPLSDEKEKIKAAYQYVRDEIRHSGDIGSARVTKSASEALEYQEGICLAKSLLLAAILRCGGIPAGLCYQRLVKDDKPGSGYIVHGLNAVFLSREKKWIRLDARGNKQGVNAQFSFREEKLAFPVRAARGEIDYPTIYATPHPLVMGALEKCQTRCEYGFDFSEI